MNPVQFVMPKPDEAIVEKWIKLAMEIIITRGITNIHDAWQDPTTVKVLQQLSETGKLPIRIYGMLGSSHPKLLKHFFKEGIFRSEKYNIRSVKAFIDGALGSRGAALLEPYCDDINNCGLILISEKEFKDLAKRCRDANFQLCTHAIGDKGNKMVLDIYSKTITSSINHRWRIEHAQMVSNEDVPKTMAQVVESLRSDALRVAMDMGIEELLHERGKTKLMDEMKKSTFQRWSNMPKISIVKATKSVER